LSIYLLDIDGDCPLKSQIDSGLIELPDDTSVAETYQLLQVKLSELGFTSYEISNYSRLGSQSIHNIRYWQRRPYLGFGPGAASNIGNLRWTENKDLHSWLNDKDKQDIQLLTPEESLAEIPLLALRMRDGIDWDLLCKHAKTQGLCHRVAEWEQELLPFVQRGLLRWENGNLRLTANGVLLSNQVFEIFI
jgi:oxygen-independent coproporphyrinogen-3 oxidase